MSRCQWDKAWIGQCRNEAQVGDKYCKEHQKQCICCGKDATGECSETCGLVCGAPLCDNCEHELDSSGCNKRGSFHVKKGEQKYYDWIYQEVYGVKERMNKEHKEIK